MTGFFITPPRPLSSSYLEQPGVVRLDVVSLVGDGGSVLAQGLDLGKLLAVGPLLDLRVGRAQGADIDVHLLRLGGPRPGVEPPRCVEVGSPPPHRRPTRTH